MDYRTYAYLQTAQDRAARASSPLCPRSRARFNPDAIGSAAPGYAGVFALAAIPARYALERGAWADAAKLEPHPSRFLYADALTYFAKALGAARVRDASATRSAIDALARSRNGSRSNRKPTGPSRRRFSGARRRPGWRFVEGRRAKRLPKCAPRRALEDGNEKSAVTPGPLAPARELVGELLLAMNQPGEALRSSKPRSRRNRTGSAPCSAPSGRPPSPAIVRKARTYYGSPARSLRAGRQARTSGARAGASPRRLSERQARYCRPVRAPTRRCSFWRRRRHFWTARSSRALRRAS